MTLREYAAVTILILALVAAVFTFDSMRAQDRPKIESDSFVIKSDPSATHILICISDESAREHIRAVVLEGLEEAMHEQAKTVFLVWMKDGTSQPMRAQVGIRRAVSSYLQARQLALDWMPPKCGDPNAGPPNP